MPQTFGSAEGAQGIEVLFLTHGMDDYPLWLHQREQGVQVAQHFLERGAADALKAGRYEQTLGGPGTSSMGYIDIAKSGGGTWFETPQSFWPQLKEGLINAGVDPKLAGLKADNAAFLVNEQFLLQQAEVGMQFRLVNTTQHHAKQFFQNTATMREINMLNSEQFKARGYVKQGNTWIKSQP